MQSPILRSFDGRWKSLETFSYRLSQLWRRYPKASLIYLVRFSILEILGSSGLPNLIIIRCEKFCSLQYFEIKFEFNWADL